MAINVQHMPSAASLAGPAFNAGFGNFLQNYQKFLQPERMQAKGFAQQRQGQLIDIAAQQQAQARQQRFNAASQASQQQYGLAQSLMQNQNALQRMYFDGQQRAGLAEQQFGYNQQLQEMRGSQQQDYLERQMELSGLRADAAFRQGLVRQGIYEQDRAIRGWRSSAQNLNPQDQMQIDGLLNRRQQLLNDGRRLLPAEQGQLLQKNFADIQKAFSNATKMPSIEERLQPQLQAVASLNGVDVPTLQQRLLKGGKVLLPAFRSGEWALDLQEYGDSGSEAKMKQEQFKMHADYQKYVADVYKSRQDFVKSMIDSSMQGTGEDGAAVTMPSSSQIAQWQQQAESIFRVMPPPFNPDMGGQQPMDGAFQPSGMGPQGMQWPPPEQPQQSLSQPPQQQPTQMGPQTMQLSPERRLENAVKAIQSGQLQLPQQLKASVFSALAFFKKYPLLSDQTRAPAQARYQHMLTLARVKKLMDGM